MAFSMRDFLMDLALGEVFDFDVLADGSLLLEPLNSSRSSSLPSSASVSGWSASPSGCASPSVSLSLRLRLWVAGAVRMTDKEDISNV